MGPLNYVIHTIITGKYEKTFTEVVTPALMMPQLILIETIGF